MTQVEKYVGYLIRSYSFSHLREKGFTHSDIAVLNNVIVLTVGFNVRLFIHDEHKEREGKLSQNFWQFSSFSS